MLSKILFVLGVSVIGSAIGCDLKAQWASSCKSPQLIPMDEAMKKAILDKHNTLRNDIAMKKIGNYDSAANMATMVWDDELAASAALNVRQCEMKHDDCGKTGQFKSSGQNLAMSMTSGSAQSTPEQIAKMAGGWFDEQANGGSYGWMKLINEFQPGDTNGKPPVLHFTQFVRASAQKVGCAVSTSKKNQNGMDWNATWLACDYSYGNMIGTPVYQTGAPASKCQTGKNTNYPGLCSTNEKYNV